MKTIAIANQKGGTGKTTTAYNLGIALTQQGYRVLMVDFDPQGDLSFYCGVPPEQDLDQTITELLVKVARHEPISRGECVLRSKKYDATTPQVDFIPADLRLASFELTMGTIMCYEVLLRSCLSAERQHMYLQRQIDDVIEQIALLKSSRAENFTIKQMERTRKQLKKKLDKLNDQQRKDDVVTFEDLGVDSLMVDEAHYFKNAMIATKMRNVAGISQTESQKSSDMLMKCMYLDEMTGGHGIVFATGTPISNSMTEMYVMMRYLQRGLLEKEGLLNFDSWASTFGESITAIELNPTGTGYRTKTRFARFYNLPELMSLFKMSADIQTADMLHVCQMHGRRKSV